MSHDTDHGATTVRASKGGGGKWLLGGLAALLLAGGGYFAWQNYGSGAQSGSETQTAYNDQYANDPVHAGPVDQGASSGGASTDDSVAAAPPASSDTRAPAPVRHSSARTTTAAVPEETIGITPVSATTQEDEDVVVTAPPRPVWASVPNARRLSAFYPQTALQRGREGEASLHCTVLGNGELACERISETPGGFGGAAMRVAHTLRHAQTLADGSDATGTDLNLRVVFSLPDERSSRG